ncbi:MAG TPA: hypothetical protein V6D16_01125 [Candidatus Obscuribacterales bacterium]
MNEKLISLITLLLLTATPSSAAELLFNPREASVQKLIYGQSSTLVVGNDVLVRALPTKLGNGGFAFAKLIKGDRVYILGCEGFTEGHYWVNVYVPDIKEIGYVAAEFLQNNYNYICDRSR